MHKIHLIQHKTSQKEPKQYKSIIIDWLSRGLVGWGLTALLTQNRSYRACRFVGIFYSKL